MKTENRTMVRHSKDRCTDFHAVPLRFSMKNLANKKSSDGQRSNHLSEEINMAERVLKPIILSGVQEDQID